MEHPHFVCAGNTSTEPANLQNLTTYRCSKVIVNETDDG